MSDELIATLSRLASDLETAQLTAEQSAALRSIALRLEGMAGAHERRAALQSQIECILSETSLLRACGVDVPPEAKLHWHATPALDVAECETLVKGLLEYLERSRQLSSATETAMEHADELQMLWVEGTAGRVVDRGWDLHAAIVACHRPSSELPHRIWRGQVRVLLPLLEGARAAIEFRCRELIGNEAFAQLLSRQRTASRAPGVIEPPGSESNGDDTVELRELAGIVSHVRALEGRGWLSRSMQACHARLRNPLAHGQSVTADDMMYLVRLYGRSI